MRIPTNVILKAISIPVLIVLTQMEVAGEPSLRIENEEEGVTLMKIDRESS